MLPICINPQGNRCPTGAVAPEKLPPPKQIILHPSDPGGENASLFYVGSATTIIEWAGIRLMTDPDFRISGDHARLSPGISSTRLTNPAIDLRELPRIDIILLSHYHGDHFDEKTKASLRRDIPIITNPQGKTYLTSKHPNPFKRVHALNPFDHIMVDIEGTMRTRQPRLRVIGMPGKHIPSNPVIESLNALAQTIPPTNGWMLEFGYGTSDTSYFECGYRIYITGDTLFVDELQEIAQRYEGEVIDLMLAHLGGVMIPSPSMDPLTVMITMNAEEGIELMKLVKPDITIPIHYDDYDIFASPLEDFRRLVDANKFENHTLFLERGDVHHFKVKSINIFAMSLFHGKSKSTRSIPSNDLAEPRGSNNSQRDRPTVNTGTSESHYRRPKRSLFTRPSSGILERSVSVKNRQISQPISQPGSPWFTQNLEEQAPNTSEDQGTPRLSSTYQEHHRPFQQVSDQTHPASNRSQQSQSQQSQSQSQHQQQQQQQQQQQHQPTPAPPPPHQGQLPRPPQSIQRSFTDLSFTFAEQYKRNSTSAQSLFNEVQDVNSRQPEPPLSPLPPQTPDMQASPEKPPGPTDRAHQDSGRSGRSSAQETTDGRHTPTSNRIREDPLDSTIDVRALVQKHEELQAKYSKVKRYYFEKEAQVQHLQNTVAHQRMAVSRTVLDDNEYANRFQRLDGAIKDLAFSVRKDWRVVPSWLRSLVSDDAVAVGTKEMTAIGRAVISRWLVEEVFQRHFHPGLDQNLSLQLKSIEMNLRRQQVRSATDEDRENLIARLSNWRRTTFDGLGEILTTPSAQDHRIELVEQLTGQLASFLTAHLHESGLPGLEPGVGMIITNTVNIIEKIPLEARDVCVEYPATNILFNESSMKVESQLPPLSHPPPPPIEESEEASAGENDTPSPPSNPVDVSTTPREPKKKSVFGALMGRKTSAEPSRPAGHAEEKVDSSELARIRFASFPTVEVHGKGPTTVLVKSPVWLVE
ncbi:hypothetical protein N7495_009202 [Penicillium taxi]|uniref:uncharacterized protein n=1 Tax=Penicillium taxi TaxID=168475 RepID=UPI00254582D3|nr:uncharacterized protein N7495_009202 [Penicillium taxi]KAJ5884692.1 hypothetical protein N7495_009202 [Penicillium taxi]